MLTFMDFENFFETVSGFKNLALDQLGYYSRILRSNEADCHFAWLARAIFEDICS